MLISMINNPLFIHSFVKYFGDSQLSIVLKLIATEESILCNKIFILLILNNLNEFRTAFYMVKRSNYILNKKSNMTSYSYFT